MMRDAGKIIRWARGFSSPFPVQQFSKTRFSVATRLPPCGYFAEIAISITPAKGGFAEKQACPVHEKSIIH